MSGTEDSAESRDDELVGRAIGKYTLGRVIGRGGMGVVYEAQNTAIGKRVAIKLVSAELAKNKDAVKRFQREAQAASAVESAHIVDIFDAGVTDEGVPYIVMELLRGEDLGHRIKRLGRLDLEDALHVTMQILRGLGRAHTAGIVHRDLKPDNVFLVDRDDDAQFVKVLDFGISKVARRGETPVQTLTKQGTVLGTPFYMAPEQAQGLPDTDGRADLWSVGAILYECLTGRAPHTGASYEQVIVNICAKDAADVRTHNPGVPEGIAKVLQKALSRDREDRFASAREFMEALASASGGTLSMPPRSSDEPGLSDGSGRFGAMSPSGAQRRLGSGSGARSGSGAGLGSGSGARVGTPAFDDTVEMKGGGPSRVGWATSGNPIVRRDRRRLVAVAFAAVGAGLVAMLAIGLRKPPAGASTGEDGARPGGGHGAAAALELPGGANGAQQVAAGTPGGDAQGASAAGAQGANPQGASPAGTQGGSVQAAGAGAGQGSSPQGASLGGSQAGGAQGTGALKVEDPSVRNGTRTPGGKASGAPTSKPIASGAASALPATTATATTPPPAPTLTIKLD